MGQSLQLGRLQTRQISVDVRQGKDLLEAKLAAPHDPGNGNQDEPRSRVAAIC